MSLVAECPVTSIGTASGGVDCGGMGTAGGGVGGGGGVGIIIPSMIGVTGGDPQFLLPLLPPRT